MSAGKVSLGRSRRFIAGAAVCALFTMLVQTGAAAPGAAAGASGAALAGLSGPHVFGGGITNPYAISSDGSHVWVANEGTPGFVTDLNARTGGVKVISGLGINNPVGISSDGTHVWVANNGGGGSVTELNAATGALVQVISGSSYGISQPRAVSSDGTDVWVANVGDESVSGFPAASSQR